MPRQPLVGACSGTDVALQRFDYPGRPRRGLMIRWHGRVEDDEVILLEQGVSGEICDVAAGKERGAPVP